MAWEQNPYAVKITLAAGEDLSAKQFCFVKLSSTLPAGTTTPACIAATQVQDYAIGILQNQPKNYGEAEVTISGITKVVSGATNIVIGSRLSVDTSGRAVPVTATAATGSTKYIFGTALSASSAAGDIVTMVVSTTAAVLSA